MNLVRLLGYCQEERQVLIYEFAEEGSIWDHLQGQNYFSWKEIGSCKICFWLAALVNEAEFF